MNISKYMFIAGVVYTEIPLIIHCNTPTEAWGSMTVAAESLTSSCRILTQNMNASNTSRIDRVENTFAVPILTSISASLSIAGSIGIFLLINKHRPVYYIYQLLVYLTVADLLSAISNFVGSIRYLSKYGGLITVEEASTVCEATSDAVCIGQAFLTTLACLASFWWTFLITVHHFLLGVTGVSFLEQRVWKATVHGLAWINPGEKIPYIFYILRFAGRIAIVQQSQSIVADPNTSSRQHFRGLW